MSSTYKNKVKSQGVDDMVLLGKLNNDEIVTNLKKRYLSDIIYTYISDVLISVNPFKLIPNSCGPEQIELYKGRYRYEVPPHVFALAENAYRKMVNEGDNQCVIISGESGAGKTEASKLIMQYIAAVSGKSDGVEKVKRIILESNPLLEAFGNAKTIRNNNSSRFGKYFEIQFDAGGDPKGGKITNYLLEKSRVVSQSKNERNFHIFYQLLVGATQREKDEFGLTRPEDYAYLNKGGCYTVDGIDDVAEFKDTKRAMDVMGITQQEQKNIFQLLAGILWLGNIQFVELHKDTGIKNMQALEFAASLLGVKPDRLKKVLTYKTLNAGGNIVDALQNPDQASHIRDALSKTIYDRLFDWLVAKINLSMKTTGECRVISVLDIYGFEIFDKNGFEQFCINYVNEKLQQIFIELTLKSEQEEYDTEGIKWEPIKYFNNKIVCDLIEEIKPPGIMAVLDDTCKKVHAMDGGKTDETFVGNLNAISHPHLHIRNNGFTIKHYAGDVVYASQGFTERNKDTLFADLVQCMQSSTDAFTRNFFPDDTSVKKAPTSAGYKIKKSSQELVEALKKCSPHYVRCIKPNESKKPLDFIDSRVKHQVEYLGLLENIKVRRAGFAYRHTYDKVLERFKILSKKTWPHYSGDARSGCVAILEDPAVNIEKSQWQCGRTKLFIRLPETYYQLEELRERKYHDAATKIARAWRSYKLRKYYADLREQACTLLGNSKERRRNSINRPFIGDHINFDGNAQLQLVMKQYSEPIVYTDKFFRPMRNMLMGHRIDEMTMLVTNNAIYWTQRVKVKKQFEVQLIKRAILASIESVCMSTLCDNYVIVRITNDDTMVGTCENKVEFLTILNDQYKQKMKKDVNREFATDFEYCYDHKKNKVKKFSFKKDDTVVMAEPKLESSSKGFVLSVNSGLPADTQPKGRSTRRKMSANKTKNPGLKSNMPHARPSPSLVYEPIEVAKTTMEPKRPPPPPPKVNADPRKMLKVMYGYNAGAADELSMSEGDTIALEVEDPSGWWVGENLRTKKKGMFPGNYCQPE
ncbi:myosin I heavy chain [Acrasis kona]|uniref:Myosin I heavy chain n=1 Tax=Acrasis kona TaxID=1008807 RepID=A0AAW2ZMI0_9EUKA